MHIITAIDEAASADQRINILRSASAIELRAFEYAIDPLKTYGIGKYRHVDMANLGNPSDYMFTLLDKILAKAEPMCDLKNEVLRYVAMNGELIKLVLNKSIVRGVSVATLNKAHKGFIKVHKIQKAKEIPLAKVTFPLLLEQKYDGVRITAILKGESGVKLHTASGRCPVFPLLEADLAKLEATDIVLDGELIWGLGKKEDRKIMTGQLNKALRGNPVDEECMQLKVFDCIPLEDFTRGVCRLKLIDRLRLMPCFGAVDRVAKSVSHHVPNAGAAMVEYDALIGLGYEGIMLKNPSGFYSFKRTDAWIKVKETNSIDMVCVDAVGGEGKFTGMIGALVLEGLIGNKTIKVSVGSGLSNADRLKDPSEYIGKTIEVDYNSISESKSKEHASLFLPRFHCIRQDL